MRIPVVHVPPTTSAVPLQYLKRHLRLVVSDDDEFTEEDALLEKMAMAATQEYEDTYKVTLVKTGLQWDFERFQRKMELPRPPLFEVEEIAYIDSHGAAQTVGPDNYRVVTATAPGYVLFNTDFSPDLDPSHPYPVSVKYTAGSDTVDESIQIYIANIVGTLYNIRESVLVGYGAGISVHDLRKNMAGLIKGKPKALRFG